MYLQIPEIKKFSQSIAESLSLIFNWDVFILDSNLNRVVFTDTSKNLDDFTINKECIIENVLNNNHTCYIHNKESLSLCSCCTEKTNCSNISGLFIPITLNKCSIGVLGFFVYNDEDEKKLNKNFKTYEQLMLKMSNLLVSNLQLYLYSNRLSDVLENIPYCIIVIDKDGYVKFVNKSAQTLLDVKSNEILNNQLKNYYACNDINSSLQNNTPLKITKVKFKSTLSDKIINAILNIQISKNKYMENSFICFFEECKDISTNVEEDSLTKAAFSKIKGNSPELKKVIDFASKVALSSSTILLTGESGTGKELFAKSIHDCSPRKNFPFIAVNCSSIPNNLLESELFGYDEGAFTGSKKSGKKGKFELANNGTLFLDEIGDMDFSLQAKILRVLEEHEVERLGSNESIKLNIRIISATNKKLDEMVENNLFREDLYYRLNVIPIQLPPLRVRKSDISILINYYLDKYNKELSKNILGIDTHTLNVLLDYDWPGNIRELANVIEYTMHMEIDDYIHYNSLPARIINHVNDSYKSEHISTTDVHDEQQILPDDYDEIFKAIKLFGNSTDGKKKAAKHLNMSLSTLYRKLSQYNNLKEMK